MLRLTTINTNKHLLKTLTTLAAIGLALLPTNYNQMFSADEAPSWIQVSNGKNPDGREQQSGVAEYTVEDGAIVGCTVHKAINNFLCTQREYGDRILEFEFKATTGMSSSVPFRSLFIAKDTVLTIKEKEKVIPADRVHGHQY